MKATISLEKDKIKLKGMVKDYYTLGSQRRKTLTRTLGGRN
jgi:hypothetical protein